MTTIGVMTCQRCNRRFELREGDDRRAFEAMLDAHMIHHRLEDAAAAGAERA